MDDLIADMFNKRLAEIDNAKYSRHNASLSPQMIAWKFLDGDRVDIRIVVNSEVLNNVTLSEN